MLAPSAKPWRPPSFQAVHLSSFRLRVSAGTMSLEGRFFMFALRFGGEPFRGGWDEHTPVAHHMASESFEGQPGERGSEICASVVIWKTTESPWEHGADFTGAAEVLMGTHMSVTQHSVWVALTQQIACTKSQKCHHLSFRGSLLQPGQTEAPRPDA